MTNMAARTINPRKKQLGINLTEDYYASLKALATEQNLTVSGYALGLIKAAQKAGLKPEDV